ncbi:uncharacterized protein LOC122364116 isoform X1 [Amphibalanus amphitrite]|uniref:uncharacterized protein LOC122364116 isoform X1 n=1 Tax=Amphibalanus amphitrite TaxID=1232801 RepID=UPI001C91C78B|nr:uncharacterized protein LOC122364116 isoform X1 [Amphibalanus amphitrite]
MNHRLEPMRKILPVRMTFLNKTIYPDQSPFGSERGSISSGRLGSSARAGSGASRGSNRGNRGGSRGTNGDIRDSDRDRGGGGRSARGSGGRSPVQGGLDPPLAGPGLSEGELTNVPVAGETGSATGGGGGGGPSLGMRRTIRWGDDAEDLPARLEGIVETSRDTRNHRWTRQHLSVHGHTLVTPDLRLRLPEVTIRSAPETSHRNAVKICRGHTPELFLKFRSRDDYRSWLGVLRAGSGQQTDDTTSDVSSDVTDEKNSVGDVSEKKVSVSYGENNTVNISYGGAAESEKLLSSSGGGGLEFETWEVAEAADDSTDGAAVDLGEEACSDVSDQLITGLDAPGLAASRGGGPIFSLDDIRSNTPPPAFADQPVPPNSVRWDLELHSADLQRTPARGSTLGSRWGRPATPPGGRFRRRSVSPPASLTSNGGGKTSVRGSSGAAAACARQKLRSVETQTDSGKFGMRRAGSEWALLERSAQTASIRSERIRRAAQMFEEIAQAERAAALALSPLPRRPAPEDSPEPQPEPEPEPEPAVEQERRSQVAASRSVDAIVALGGPEGEDSDRDEESEELLWLRVKTKIAERRQKFHQLDLTARGGGETTEETRPTQVAPPSPLPALSRPVLGSSLSESEGASSPVTSGSLGDDLDTSGSTGDGSDTLRCWTGKYIEQDEEQEVLRRLGNPVLAEQKLNLKLKTRTRLEAGRAESERQKQRIQEQRDQTQLKLDQVKAKLTRDGAFERKRLETVLYRLDQSIREEQQRLSQLTRRITETDGDIEGLERRLSHLVVESDTRALPLSPLE